MSSDKLVFDLSQEIEGSPNVFVKRDVLNILDNMNAQYNSNVCVIDTSQLSNSNKYMSYRESYLLVPLLLTLSTSNGCFNPGVAATSSDYAIGLKNWFGHIFHSMTVEYNGVSIIQQVPFSNMWNIFKLMTSLSWNDVITQGSTIGFYPDDPLSWAFYATPGTSGQGTCNNTNYPSYVVDYNIATTFNTYSSKLGNVGFARRQQFINFDLDGTPGDITYATLLPQTAVNNLWKSYIFKKYPTAAATTGGILEIAVTSTVYLKHLHSFFAMMPLIKGAFLKITLALNNTTTTFQTIGTANQYSYPVTSMTLTSVANAVGGVNPLMIASALASNGGANMGGITNDAVNPATYIATVSVGGKCLNNTVASLANYAPSPLAQSVYLYVPSYTFNPIFEQAYLSSPIKQIKYTDIYSYQVFNVAANNGQVNQLLTNGISNVKSILILPFFSATAGTANTGLPTGIPVYQSPYDTAGCGTTSPLSLLTNFNVILSGQNMLYLTQKYAFEQFNNNLAGCNSVNSNLTDGLCSSLINSLGFEMAYCYYYVNLERMLPVEESVPKSVQVVGTNNCGKALDLFCFIEYGVDISIDILTGSRV